MDRVKSKRLQSEGFSDLVPESWYVRLILGWESGPRVFLASSSSAWASELGFWPEAESEETGIGFGISPSREGGSPEDDEAEPSPAEEAEAPKSLPSGS